MNNKPESNGPKCPDCGHEHKKEDGTCTCGCMKVVKKK